MREMGEGQSKLREGLRENEVQSFHKWVDYDGSKDSMSPGVGRTESVQVGQGAFSHLLGHVRQNKVIHWKSGVRIYAGGWNVGRDDGWNVCRLMKWWETVIVQGE